MNFDGDFRFFLMVGEVVAKKINIVGKSNLLSGKSNLFRGKIIYGKISNN